MPFENPVFWPKSRGGQIPSHGPLFWTPRQNFFGVMGLFFGPLGQLLMISWKQKRCATSVRSFWRLYQAISSHMDPFQTNFDANKHSQISRRRQNDRTDVAHLFCFQEIIKNWPRGQKKRPMTPKKVCLGVQKRGPWLGICPFGI